MRGGATKETLENFRYKRTPGGLSKTTVPFVFDGFENLCTWAKLSSTLLQGAAISV